MVAIKKNMNAGNIGADVEHNNKAAMCTWNNPQQANSKEHCATNSPDSEGDVEHITVLRSTSFPRCP